MRLLAGVCVNMPLLPCLLPCPCAPCLWFVQTLSILLSCALTSLSLQGRFPWVALCFGPIHGPNPLHALLLCVASASCCARFRAPLEQRQSAVRGAYALLASLQSYGVGEPALCGLACVCVLPGSLHLAVHLCGSSNCQAIRQGCRAPRWCVVSSV